MEQIEKAYRYVSAKRLWNAIGWFFCGVFAFLMGLLQAIQEDDFIRTMIFAALLVITLASCVFVVVRSKKRGFLHSPIYKSLVELGYADEFLNTIDSEMRYNLKIHYTYGAYPLNLFVTETWLIFISINNSIIRKVADVSRVSKVFSPVGRQSDLLCIEFIDGKFFYEPCGWNARAEIVELFAKEFPFMVQQDVK